MDIRCQILSRSHFQDVIVSVERSFVLSMFITENTCSQRYVVPYMHKSFVARDVTLGQPA